VTLNNLVTVGNFGHGGSVLLDVLVLEELGSDSGANQDLNFFMRLEGRGHLLVGDKLKNIVGRCIRVLVKILASPIDSKFCRTEQKLVRTKAASTL
jgi:hypothetical protein